MKEAENLLIKGLLNKIKIGGHRCNLRTLFFFEALCLCAKIYSIMCLTTFDNDIL